MDWVKYRELMGIRKVGMKTLLIPDSEAQEHRKRGDLHTWFLRKVQEAGLNKDQQIIYDYIKEEKATLLVQYDEFLPSRKPERDLAVEIPATQLRQAVAAKQQQRRGAVA